jgi:hypothetical protein
MRLLRKRVDAAPTETGGCGLVGAAAAAMPLYPRAPTRHRAFRRSYGSGRMRLGRSGGAAMPLYPRAPHKASRLPALLRKRVDAAPTETGGCGLVGAAAAAMPLYPRVPHKASRLPALLRKRVDAAPTEAGGCGLVGAAAAAMPLYPRAPTSHRAFRRSYGSGRMRLGRSGGSRDAVVSPRPHKPSRLPALLRKPFGVRSGANDFPEVRATQQDATALIQECCQNPDSTLPLIGDIRPVVGYSLDSPRF